MIRRIIPSPLLSISLCALWVVLNHSLSLAHIVLGIILGIFIPIATSGLRPLPVKVKKPSSIIKLAFTVFIDTSVSNIQVVKILLFPKLRKNQPGFVKIPLNVRDPNALAVLAMITCLTPGTAWAEISRDRSLLLMHVLELDDEAKIISQIKQKYENPLMEIFE